MSDLVLDASAFVFAHTETTVAAKDVRARVARSAVHAPHLLIAEVGSVARRLVAKREAKPERCWELVTGAAAIVSCLYSHDPLSRLAWSLRDNVSFYDALYVSLAASLGLPLLTADARLGRAPNLPCAVEVVS